MQFAMIITPEIFMTYFLYINIISTLGMFLVKFKIKMINISIIIDQRYRSVKAELMQFIKLVCFFKSDNYELYDLKIMRLYKNIKSSL